MKCREVFFLPLEKDVFRMLMWNVWRRIIVCGGSVLPTIDVLLLSIYIELILL